MSKSAFVRDEIHTLIERLPTLRADRSDRSGRDYWRRSFSMVCSPSAVPNEYVRSAAQLTFSSHRITDAANRAASQALNDEAWERDADQAVALLQRLLRELAAVDDSGPGSFRRRHVRAVQEKASGLGSDGVRARVDRDFRAIEEAFAMQSFMAVLVHSAAIAEALLVDAIGTNEQVCRQLFKKRRFPDEVGLRALAEGVGCVEAPGAPRPVLSARAVASAKLLAAHRNTVHPSREAADGSTPSEGMARAALGCLEHVIDELAEADAKAWLLTFELVRVREPAVEYPTTSA